MKQNDKEITWQDVYKLPLKYDGMLYARTKNYVMAITFLRLEENIRHEIINSINSGEEPIDYPASLIKIDKGCRFVFDGEPAFMIRGWGHLIGIGGLHLPSDVAAKIQDDFIAYIYKALTGKELKE